MKHMIILFALVTLFFGCTNQTESVEIKSKSDSSSLTLMIYMAADNDLESYALQNLNLMETADYKGINVLVLMDRSEGYDETDGNWTDTRLYKVRKDNAGNAQIVSERLDCPLLGLSTESSTELDMSNPSVLSNFINYVQRKFPSQNYALIIWGHGTGWRYAADQKSGVIENRAVAIDDKTGSYMSVFNLGNAVRNHGLTIIGFDTCFGGVLENVYELKDCADYTVACAGVSPSCGWDYKTLLEQISSEDFEPLQIAHAMAASSPVNTTIFKNANLEQLVNSFERFSKEISRIILTDTERKNTFDLLFNLKSYTYTQYPCDMYLDLAALSDGFIENDDENVRLAAKELKKKISETVCLTNNKVCEIGVHFIPLVSFRTTASVHSSDYIKNQNKKDQCKFIKESKWWVPTLEGNSGSVLDKLFYNGV